MKFNVFFLFSILIEVSLSAIQCSDYSGSSKGGHSFCVEGESFMKDGSPFQFVSGAFHYFRQRPEHWESTIRKMAAGGLNAIETYVAWNLHEPMKGVYKFDGEADIVKFIKIVHKYGLCLILRPGPYICAEWEFGGFPYWLLREADIEFRNNNAIYMSHVRSFYTRFFTEVAPYMYHTGNGPIVMVQIENEYGSYNVCDKSYLNALSDLTVEILGEKTLLFTTDGYWAESMVACGSVLGRTFATIDFGNGVSDPLPHFQMMRKLNNGIGPFVNSEYYSGWLDHWGEHHNKVSSTALCATLEKMLKLNASVNFYMYFGGTNFGFFNGANGNQGSTFQVDPTSYDYDAPLSEAADMTEKYYALRDVIKKYLRNVNQTNLNLDVSNSTKKAYGKVKFSDSASLFDIIDVVGQRKEIGSRTKSFEALDCDYGYVLYSTKLHSKSGNETRKLKIPKVHDRATVYFNKIYVGTIARTSEATQILNISNLEGDLDILVESQGRLNYGTDFVDYKGILDGVFIDDESISSPSSDSEQNQVWTMIGFNLTNSKDFSKKFKKGALPTKVPSFYRGFFEIKSEDGVCDTFLSPRGFKKGVAIINGHVIGRYWPVMPPQLTLFVPSAFLKVGKNELIVFEHESQSDEVYNIFFTDKPNIDYSPEDDTEPLQPPDHDNFEDDDDDNDDKDDDENKKEEKKDETLKLSLIIAGVFLVATIIVVGVGLFFYYKLKKGNDGGKDTSMQMKLNDASNL